MQIEQQWLYIALILLIIIGFFLFWKYSYAQQQLAQWGQALRQAQAENEQNTQKIDRLREEKSQLEQWAIQQQTIAESNAQRLSERDIAIQRLNQQLSQAESQEDQLESYIHQLKERIGGAVATVTSLEERLQENQQQLATKENQLKNLQAQFSSTVQELTELRVSWQEKQANFEQQQQQFREVRQHLNSEFQHLAQQVLEEKSKLFAQSHQSSLDLLLKPFKEQIEGFQKRVNEVHSEALKGNANLEAEIKRVLDVGLSMSQEAQSLTSALKGNNKVAGNWGEMQLEAALQAAGLLKEAHYLAQESFRNEQGQRFSPDFVVKLPDDKHLVIDSKVSLLAYEQAVNIDDISQQDRLMNEHCRSLRTHIEGLSKKNYQSLNGIKSPDFVLMFVPIEPAYIEAMKHDPALFNYGYERNVILVSHTTLMPILRTVANLWRIERGNLEAREISERAGDIYNQVCVIAERLNRLGNTLSTVNNQYNQTVTSLVGKQGLLGKVERFQTLSAKAQQKSPEVALLNPDLDTNRLAISIEKLDEVGEM